MHARSNLLSMALNKVCDAPAHEGVAMYRRIFLEPGYVATLPPSQVAIVRQLETAIDELVRPVHRVFSCARELTLALPCRSSPSFAASSFTPLSSRPT